MKIISVVNEKGGTGKTTTATNLAVAAFQDGHSVGLIDADPQGSSTLWGGLRRSQFPEQDRLKVFSMADDFPGLKLREIIPLLLKGGEGALDYIIIDAGGRIHEISFAAVRMADFCLVPIQSGRADLEATNGFWQSVIMEIAEYKSDLRAGILINGWSATTIQNDTLQHAVSFLNYPVLESTLSHLTAYQKAFALGLGVLEIDHSTKPTSEILSLFEEIQNHFPSEVINV